MESGTPAAAVMRRMPPLLAGFIASVWLLTACSTGEGAQPLRTATADNPGPTLTANASGVAQRSTSAALAAKLSGVNDFLYQLQDLELEAVGASGYDLVIMDYSADGTGGAEYTASEIESLKNSPGGPKVLLAYMSIGEAEDYRFYWQERWVEAAPAWLGAVNPDWPGNYKVRYWDEAWQDIIFDYTTRLVDAGFDGAYLDIIDAYRYFQERGDESAAARMSAFVAAIGARARSLDPDFLIFPQNGPELAGLAPGYLDSVEGIGQEDLYFGYEEDGQATPSPVTAELEGHLDRFKDAGKLVLTIDYASSAGNVDESYRRARERGYVPFVTTRDLDTLTINAGHIPD